MFDEEGCGSGAPGGAHGRPAARTRAVAERPGLGCGRPPGPTAADRPWREVTVCGAIPRFRERECPPFGAVQP
ncbi:hypothetical protein GCM10010275_03950 [Streptomyces litmocidini]|nr:hypothetical protein GCM10010275_03950 [Streptomyces litmocidini]